MLITFRSFFAFRVAVHALACAAVILVGTTGCGGGSTTGNDGGGTSPGSSHLRATIDGKAWASDSIATVVSASAKSSGTITIQGTQVAGSSFTGLVLSLGFISGPATDPLGVNPGTTAGGTGQVVDATGANWMTDLNGSSGSITFSSFGSGRMAGTFQFTAPPGLGSTATSTREITGGEFDLALPAAFAMRAADDYGSVVSATLNGQPFNAATVVGSGSSASGAFGIASSTSALSLNLTTSMAVSNGGSYDQTAITFQAVNSKTAQGYGGAGTAASLTITMLSATRVAGTFTATLPPLSGSGAALVFTDGKFDVRVQ